MERNAGRARARGGTRLDVLSELSLRQIRRLDQRAAP